MKQNKITWKVEKEEQTKISIMTTMILLESKDEAEIEENDKQTAVSDIVSWERRWRDSSMKFQGDAGNNAPHLRDVPIDKCGTEAKKKRGQNDHMENSEI